MKALLLPFFALSLIACTNSNAPDKNGSTVKIGKLEYPESDFEFIKKADSICRAIDSESQHVRTITKMVTDRDGQQYPVEYKGHAKSSLDSVTRFQATVFLTDTKRAHTIYYYYNDAVIKGITQIFAYDTVDLSFYYDGGRMIYPIFPKEERMDEIAENTRKESIEWRKFFPLGEDQ